MKTKRYYLLLAVGGLLFLGLWYRQGSLMPLPFSYLNPCWEAPPVSSSCLGGGAYDYEANEMIDSPRPTIQAPTSLYSIGDSTLCGTAAALRE